MLWTTLRFESLSSSSCSSMAGGKRWKACKATCSFYSSLQKELSSFKVKFTVLPLCALLLSVWYWMAILCICAWTAFFCFPHRASVFSWDTWLLSACSSGLICVFFKPHPPLLFTSVQLIQSCHSLWLFYEEGIPHPHKDMQTATKEAEGRAP